MSKKKKKSILKSRFYRVYFSVVTLALIAIVIGLIWLNGFLRDYELSQPDHAAEEVVRIFKDGDFARLYALDTAAQSLSDSDEAFYIQSMADLTGGADIDWQNGYSMDDNLKNYTVTLDGQRFASFTLVPSGQTTGHGQTLWQLGTLTTHVTLAGTDESVDAGAEASGPNTADAQNADGTGGNADAVMESAQGQVPADGTAAQPGPTESEAISAQAPAEPVAWRIKAPTGYAVTVDGTALTYSDIVTPEIAILPEGFLPSGITAPTLTEYAFTSSSAQPVVIVTGNDGRTFTAQEEGPNALICPLPEDEELKQKYTNGVISLGGKIAKYTAKDLTRNAIVSYAVPDSPAAKMFKNFSNTWAPKHRHADVVDPVITQFHMINNDCLVCHLEFNFVLTTSKGEKYEYPTAYTFCVTRYRGEARLYNLTFH